MCRVNFHYYPKSNVVHLIITITDKIISGMWLIHFISVRIILKVCSLYLLYKSRLDLARGPGSVQYILGSCVSHCVKLG